MTVKLQTKGEGFCSV